MLSAPDLAAVVLTEVNPTYDRSGELLEHDLDTVVGAVSGADQEELSVVAARLAP